MGRGQQWARGPYGPNDVQGCGVVINMLVNAGKKTMPPNRHVQLFQKYEKDFKEEKKARICLD